LEDIITINVIIVQIISPSLNVFLKVFLAHTISLFARASENAGQIGVKKIFVKATIEKSFLAISKSVTDSIFKIFEIIILSEEDPIIVKKDNIKKNKP